VTPPPSARKPSWLLRRARSAEDAVKLMIKHGQGVIGREEPDQHGADQALGGEEQSGRFAIGLIAVGPDACVQVAGPMIARSSPG
jgi:hypothetical protein